MFLTTVLHVVLMFEFMQRLTVIKTQSLVSLFYFHLHEERGKSLNLLGPLVQLLSNLVHIWDSSTRRLQKIRVLPPPPTFNPKTEVESTYETLCF
jgi:hypothetical protein